MGLIISDLTDENKTLYMDYIDADVAENLERTIYRGIIACDDFGKPEGGMVWRYKRIDPEEALIYESVIEWIRADIPEAFEMMMNAYRMRILGEEVVRSKVQIPVKNGKQMKDYLKNAGFDMKLTESDTAVMKLSELAGTAIMKKLKGKKIPGSIKPIKDISPLMFKTGIAKCVLKGKTGLCDDLGNLFIKWFETDVSCASVDGKDVNGFFLFHRKPSELIEAQLMICLDQNFKTILPLMMYQVISAMIKKYGPDQKVSFDRHNDQVLLLAEKLIPRGFGIPVYVGTRSES